MAKVSISAAAEADYTEALCWYMQRSRRAAEGFEETFSLALHSISGSPKDFRVATSDTAFF